MITKELFIKLIEKVEKYQKEIDNLTNINFPIFDMSIYEISQDIIDLTFKSHFNEDGVDWINWYLFERVSISGKIYPYYDENDNPVYVNTPEDLWNLVKDYQLNLHSNKNASTN
jgi:hypothetical protein